MATREAPNRYLGELYAAALQSKHHYDTPSWAIAGAVFLSVGALAAYVLEIQAPSHWQLFLRRLPPALFGISLTFLWDGVYNRNRFWAEVANEKLRDFERSIGEEGIGIAFMRANHSRKVVLKNTDEAAHEVAKPYTERCSRGPMHGGVAGISRLLKIALAVAAILPW